MQRASIDAVDRAVDCVTVKRPLSAVLRVDTVALDHYELARGDSFAYGYHRHADQEEVFVVQRGTVTFETEDDDVAVGPGQAIRFAPGKFQRGTNRGDERVVALAIGAPRDGGGSTILRHCPDWGERTDTAIEWTDVGDTTVTICLECGAETDRFT